MDERKYMEHLRTLWDKNWPKDVPRQAHYPLGETLLTDYLKHWAKQKGDKPCIIYYGYELSWKMLDVLSDKFASFLADKGLKKGDRVAVFLPNCPQFYIAFYGILKLGCIHVPVSPMCQEAELQHELNDADAVFVLTLDLMYQLVQNVKDKTSIQEVMVTRLNDFLPEEPTLPLPAFFQMPAQECPDAIIMMDMLADQHQNYPQVEISLDDVAALNYTGGTTGIPKGCEHTQRDMLYTGAKIATFTSGTRLGEDDVFICYPPIFWIGGEDVGILMPMVAGIPVVLLLRWDPVAFLAGIEKYKVTFAGGLTDNIVEVINHPDAKKYDLSSLKVTLVTSFVMKFNLEIRNRWEELTGIVLRELAYGMTETHSFDTFTLGAQDDDKDIHTRPIFCGLPVDGTEIKVTDFTTREILPLGQEGEIAVKSPSLMKGYWKDPEETSRVIQNGWIFTGDIGMIDEEGYLHMLGRTKEMLKVKGMSVFPSEIEALLGQNPAIEGSGVIGKQDDKKGQMPVAFIKLKESFEGNETEDTILAWCKQKMAAYKVPTIRIVKELPLTATGKVKKEELFKLLDNK